MKKLTFFLAALTFTLSQFAFANDNSLSGAESKPCATVVKACLKAGYTRKETGHKKFWQDCMKPVLLGQTVKGVTVDAATGESCRKDKIEDMKKTLQELEK